MMIYRISEGREGSAFKHIGDFHLHNFPTALTHICLHLRANPQVVDVALTDGDGKHVIVRRADTQEKAA